jgi:serine/tyrosine/threonine adenylyltransferase
MPVPIAFDNSYARLPARFYAALAPVPVAEPRLIALNRDLAVDLGLDPGWLAGREGVAMLAGNALPAGARPIALAYAGHQFGQFVPQLGDGRAILLGEVVTPGGARRDIQLKGSGRTPFSRMGDGRAWLGPVLREYLVSEAMAAMGVPTTRALAAVTTGETVYREAALPGAVLTRVAASHIRVGTFQYFAARGDLDGLRALTLHALGRHDPDLAGADSPALALLGRVAERQARLVADWMALGFIHGVMNTDNMAISGETIDFGPCAFIDDYHPERVFSAIDRFGRYAYRNQPGIAAWNLAQLATALLPLIADDPGAAVGPAQEVIDGFSGQYQRAWEARFRARLGLARAEDGDAALAEALLDAMAGAGADFTNTFRALCGAARDGSGLDAARAGFADPGPFDAWAARWLARLGRETRTDAERQAAMRAANPAVIPRNHRIEAAITAAVAGDLAPFARLMAAVSCPFDISDPAFARPPAPAEQVTQTFCGT